MTTGPSASRFRTGRVSAPRTPAEHLQRVLDDGPRLQELFLEHADPLVRAGDIAGLVQLAAATREAADPQRAYTAHRIAATSLSQMAVAAPGSGPVTWHACHDGVVELLVPWLERQPSEPELLNMLGLACYELGHTRLARRVFEAVCTLDADHARARGNLRACRERMSRAGGQRVPSIGADLAPSLALLRARIHELATRAVQLPERTVSLCMIVKDEEEMLPGCLAAARPWVDEVIVVDTGSTDSTRQIALEHGARVVDFAWTGSFSDARNESLRHATGDWVLWLDADEHLVDDDGAHVREVIRRDWLEGAYLVETHHTGDAELGSQSVHTPMRLFRRRPHYVWEGIVHEQLLHAFPTWLPERFAHTGIRIEHYGYLKEVVEDRDKRDRNLTLLMRQAEERRDAFTCFNIGSEHAAMHAWQDALPWFEEALDHAGQEHDWQSRQFAPMLVSRTVQARRHTGREDAALDLVGEALGWWPEFTDLEFERALVHHGRGDAHEAGEAARRCLALGDAPARFVAGQGRGSFQARAVLAACMRTGGDDAGARAQLETAMDEAPHYLPLVLDLADVMLHLGDDPAAVRAQLERRLGARAEGTGASLLLATALHEAGALDEADACYQRVLDGTPDHGFALVAQAELRLAQARFDEAWSVAMRVDGSDRMSSRAGRTGFLAAVVSGHPERLADPLARIVGSPQMPAGEQALYSAWHTIVTGSATPLLAPDAGALRQLVENLEALAKLEAVDPFARLVTLLDRLVRDPRERHLLLGSLYLRRHFADMAAEEFITCVERFGPDPQTLAGLGKAATIKCMWEDAEVFLGESLQLDASQVEVRRLLALVRDRRAS